MQIYTQHQWRKAKVKSDGSGSKGLTHCPCTCLCYRCSALEKGTERRALRTQRSQKICTSVRSASTKDCTSGNETPTQNACANVPIRIVWYSYTVIVPCTVLYDIPINVAYKTLSKYFIQVLSFVTPVHITQIATRFSPNYILHSRS